MAARSLMVMGTASGVGKSVIVTGLCRALARAGILVAPFKSQNMSNNAAVCPGGGEIGRAQAAQAEACGIAPNASMNPVLLKPESDCRCQVVIMGRARFRMEANEHERYRRAAWPEIVASYQGLAAHYQIIVIEGAGSAAEINLRDRDIVNWPIAELADAPVLLVADIDKGGAFASLVGTIELISPAERRRVGGLLINKFRGDPSLLTSGLRFLEDRTGVPVLGVLPYLADLRIPDEDAADLVENRETASEATVRIGVVQLPRISNFTDFASFEQESDVSVNYLTEPAAATGIDVLAIPGSKSTVADLAWMRARGWERQIGLHLRAGGWLVGVCGGYQMLGRRILDPGCVESIAAKTRGLALLPIETSFAAEKITARVSGVELSSGARFSGYEIHAGRIAATRERRPLHRITAREDLAVDETEGSVSADGRILGTSIHGLFDAAELRRRFLDQVRTAKGYGALVEVGDDALAVRLRSYDRFADALEKHADFARIAALIGIAWPVHQESRMIGTGSNRDSD